MGDRLSSIYKLGKGCEAVTGKTWIVGIAAVYIVLGLLATGCSVQSEMDDRIFIGVAWPLEQLELEKGLDMAVRAINGQGGVLGRKVHLVKRDDRGDVSQALAIAQSFVDDPRIHAVIGHAHSYTSIPAAAIYNQAGLVMLSPGSTATALTGYGYTYVFRNTPNDQQITKELASYLAEQGLRRVVIYYEDDAYGSGLANAFEDNAKELGIEVVDRFSFYRDSAELLHLAQRWQALGADAIFLAKTVQRMGSFLQDFQAASLRLPVFAGSALDSPLLLEFGEAAQGMVVASVFNAYGDIPERTAFVNEFVEAYGVLPTAYAALGYDAVHLLAAAIGNTDLKDRSLVARQLLELGQWPGAAGVHQFRENGDNLGQLVGLKYLNDGQFHYVIQ